MKLKILIIGIVLIALPLIGTASATNYLSQYDANLVFLDHFNTSSFTDEKGHTVANFGASINTTGNPPRWGSGSVLTSASTYLNVSSGQSDFAYGAPGTSGNFTIMFWFNTSAPADFQELWNQNPQSTSGVYPSVILYNGVLEVDQSGAAVVTGTFTPAANTWYQYVLTRNGTTTTQYLNGVSNGTASDSNTYLNGLYRPMIGGYGYAPGVSGFKGYIDEAAVWTGVSIPIGNLWPQTQEIDTPIPLAPVASFTPNVTSGNAPLPVLLTDTSTNTPTSWIYQFNNVTGNNTWVTFSTSQNPTHVFNVGNYSINLTATNAGGSNISTQVTFINVSAAPTNPIASFTLNKTSGQSPLAVLATDTSTNLPNVWNWSVEDASGVHNWYNYTTSTNLVYTFNTVGSWRINLSVQNITTSSAISTASQNVTVNTTLAANFIGSPTTGFVPQDVSFVDTSTGAGIYSWLWNFGDGGTSTLQNPSHIYTTSGYQTVSLAIAGADGTASTTKVGYIFIGTGNVFTGNATLSATYGFPVKFTDTYAASHNSWNWTFGDNYTSQLQQPTHFYSVAALYNVSLNITDTNGYNFTYRKDYINLSSDVDSYVQSWLHFNGTNGGTVFNGEVGNAWTPTSVTTSTTQKRFGYSSGLFNAANSKLTTAFNNRFNFGTGDFSVEMWVYPTSTNTNYWIFSRAPDGTKTSGWGIYHSNNSATSNAWVAYFGTTATQTQPFALPLNGWSQLNVERRSGVVNVYVNGSTVVPPLTAAGNYDTISPLVFGNMGGAGGPSSYRGYIDEFRYSTTYRYGANYSSPTSEYQGNLYPVYPNENPGSTLRFKTDPSIPSNAIIYNGTARQRTTQIQYINITDNISVTEIFPPSHIFISGVTANATTYSGINFTYVNIDNTNGIMTVNLTRPGGFSTDGLTDSRASIFDAATTYWNYTSPNDSDYGEDVQYFGNGFFGNYTHHVDYPAANFIATNVTYGDWTTFSNFSVNNTAPVINEQTVLFIPKNNYSATNYTWNFGDGTTLSTTATTASHIYSTNGSKTVTLTAYLWQNNSVTNTTILTHAVDPVYNYTFVQADFVGTPTAGSVGLNVFFQDLTQWGSTNATSGRTYNWSFGDLGYSISPFSSTVGSVNHVYSNLGSYTVTLTVNNTLNNSVQTKTNYITISNSQVATTWYTQRLVTIKAVDKYGNPLPYSSMSATFLASSLPNTSTSWLVSAFGVTAGVAQQMVDGNLTLNSTTANDGSSTFMMFPGFNYGIWIYNTTSGVNHYTTIQPNDVLYVVYCPTTGQTNTNTTQQQIANTTLYITEPNISYVTFNFVYQDTSGLTTDVKWNVTEWDNGTPMYYKDYVAPGTGVIMDNYTVPNVKGQQWKFWYNASRSALV